MRKEYNSRQTAPLINPGFTIEQYEKSRHIQFWSVFNRYDLVRLVSVVSALTWIVNHN